MDEIKEISFLIYNYSILAINAIILLYVFWILFNKRKSKKRFLSKCMVIYYLIILVIGLETVGIVISDGEIYCLNSQIARSALIAYLVNYFALKISGVIFRWRKTVKIWFFVYVYFSLIIFDAFSALYFIALLIFFSLLYRNKPFCKSFLLDYFRSLFTYGIYW